jgi:hypothetical protein
MPSNVTLNPGTGGPLTATKQRLHDGDVAQVQVITLAGVTGTEDAYTFADIPGDAVNGLDVDVTRLPSLPAGGNTIGNVGVTSLPSIPVGNNNIGDVDIASMPAALTYAPHDAAVTGNPVLVGGFASAAQPSPVNADGDVVRAWLLRNGAAVNQLSAAGALIGGDATNGLDVDVTRVPSDPFGANADAASATGSISAKLRQIAAVGVPVTSLPALVAGTANIGDVDVVTLPSFMQPFEPSEAEQTIATSTTFTNTAINGSAGVALMIANEGSPGSGEDIIVKVGSGAQADNDTGTVRRRIYAGTFGTITIPSGGSLQIGVRALTGTPTVRIQRGTGSL